MIGVLDVSLEEAEMEDGSSNSKSEGAMEPEDDELVGV